MLLILGVILTLSACTTNSLPIDYDDETSDNLNVPFNIISQGAFSNISLPNQLVIKNNKDWQRVLRIHGNSPDSKKISIDFDDKIVIAVFAGQQPSGGYTVGVSNIKRINNNLLVTVTFNEPRKNQSISLALTQPYIMFSTKKIDGNIIFLAPPKKSKTK